MKKVCHVTTVHPVYDTRIFHKECKTLKEAGYHVSLVVTAAQDEEVDGITICALPPTRGRFGRIFGKTLLAARKALSTGAEFFHFHDPELIPVGLYLKARGKKVIYDIHEDVPGDILTKKWIPFLLRRAVSVTVRVIQNWSACRFDAVIAAAPNVRKRFASMGCNAFTVNNYPLLSEFGGLDIDWSRKKRAVCYVGVIGGARGIFEMVEAVARTDVRLFLGGTFGYEEDRKHARSLPGWAKVDELGQIDRKAVGKIFSLSMAGLVLFHPAPHHTEANPNKLFEYMAAGLPVIASNFPLYKEFVEGNGSGICVDPQDPEAIAKAITWIADHPVEAEQMGRRGRNAVHTRYNWDRESKILLAVYRELQ
jgi:glycosyltransferase involved in cell wall biosynthesis